MNIPINRHRFYSCPVIPIKQSSLWSSFYIELCVKKKLGHHRWSKTNFSIYLNLLNDPHLEADFSGTLSF